jgi:hypothetical protein
LEADIDSVSNVEAMKRRESSSEGLRMSNMSTRLYARRGFVSRGNIDINNQTLSIIVNQQKSCKRDLSTNVHKHNLDVGSMPRAPW